MPDPFPRADATFADYSGRFVHLVAERAVELGVDPALAAEMVQLQAQFAESFARALSDRTAGPRATFLKNEARLSLEKPMRSAARVIKSNPHLNFEQLLDLGLVTPSQKYGRRRRVSAPKEYPGVKVRLLQSGRLRVRVYDHLVPKRGKAEGAASAIIFTHVAGDRLRGELVWQMARVTTRPTCTIRLPRGLRPGDQLYVRACWLSPTAEMSPMSQPRKVRLWLGEPAAEREETVKNGRMAA